MSVAYFAYGANLASRVLQRRGIVPSEAERATLAGYRLTFADVGIPWVEPGFATLEIDAAAQVHGVLYTLQAADLQTLDAFEGGDNERLEVDVQLESGERTTATSYRSRVRRPGLRPSRRYLGVILEGAHEHGLDPQWIRELEAQPTAYVPGVSELVTFGFGFFDRLNRRSGFFDALFHP